MRCKSRNCKSSANFTGEEVLREGVVGRVGTLGLISDRVLIKTSIRLYEST